MNALAAVIVVLAGIWLLGLGTISWTRHNLTKDFLGRFASSAFSHFLEVFVRIIIGTVFVVYAPQMKFSFVFMVFGWILILTSGVLLFVPWKLHRSFADWSLPLATRHMVLFGFVSCVAGLLILFSFFLGPDVP